MTVTAIDVAMVFWIWKCKCIYYFGGKVAFGLDEGCPLSWISFTHNVMCHVSQVDMRMLKKGSVLVDKHNKMEAVKLALVVVHGQDKLAKERAAVAKVGVAVPAPLFCLFFSPHPSPPGIARCNHTTS